MTAHAPTPTPAPTLSLTPAAAPPGTKVLSREALLARRAEARRQGLRVVQCHGCFDIVHPGHLRHLRHARAQGDLLLVTITGDSQIAKGIGRPLIPQELRAENLAALDCVDWVYVEARPTAVELLDEVRPDVYVKGREYELNDDPRFRAERDAVTRHGGRVVFSSGDVVFSSTALIASLEQSVDPYHARLRALLREPALDGEGLARTVGGFRGKRVVVVGEVVQDTYVLCDRPEIAGESPIMTLRPVERRSYDGGAAIVARHLAALGARPVLVTGLPDGEAARALRQRLAAEGVEVRSVATQTPVAEKQRFLVGAQKVMKLDMVQPIELDAATQEELIGLASDAAGDAEGCDAAVVTDFAAGLLPRAVLARLCPALRERAGVLAGDVSGRRSNLPAMRGMDLVCPSESELRDAYHLFDEGLGMAAWRLLSDTGTKAAIVTMGAEGLIAFDRLPATREDEGAWTTKLKSEHVPALAAQPVDRLGAGDALLAVATLALTAGAGLLGAGFLGAVAAAVQVGRLGNTVVSAADLRHGVARVHTAHLAYSSPDVLESAAGVRRVAGLGGARALGAGA